MIKIDLNCDLGESFGAYTIGSDTQVIPIITSANIACGAHAGDPVVMKKTVELCKLSKVAVGAHPGYFDLMGFGRRAMNVSADEVNAYVTYQIGALDAFCKSAGIPLCHVKPHGAMYNMAGSDEALAQAVIKAIYNYNKDIILLGLSGSKMIDAAEAVGLRAAREVFADRAYEADGSLRRRGLDGAMITDENEAIARVIRMIKDKKVTAYTGEDIDIKADSVCVHGDGAKALSFVSELNKAFKANGIKTAPIAEVIE